MYGQVYVILNCRAIRTRTFIKRKGDVANFWHCWYIRAPKYLILLLSNRQKGVYQKFLFDITPLFSLV